MFTKTTALAAALALCTTSAFAGGLADEIVEAPVMEEAVAPVAGSSVDPTYIVVGILAALLIAAAVNNDDDDDDEPDDSDEQIEEPEEPGINF
ncbi:hypothetical protein BC777_3058 [Yoonia maricola]|uniref:Uncharacterized protein n=1 Tax=Yoonia maricola TaxID=420999 RepID=A0A2M8W2A2_9RHOB|nr:hypothetical protein [Yoonia maricola]PJI85062.1 hypothetical protein BC777_3058 [Yoonia maricola]